WSARTGSQMCLGIRFSFASPDVSNAALGDFSLNWTWLSPTAVTDSINATNGAYCGDMSAVGAWKLKTAASTVTGWPSCHISPALSVHTTVCGSVHSTFSAAYGFGSPEGSIRINRSHTNSVTQESGAPEM